MPIVTNLLDVGQLNMQSLFPNINDPKVYIKNERVDILAFLTLDYLIIST